jgi:DnaJ-class molecular chaperone
MTLDLYETLGIDRDANAADIKSAYRRLAKEHHPDICPDDPDAEQRFLDITEAYEVLSDPDTRATYDETGHFDQSAAANSRGMVAECLINLFDACLANMQVYQSDTDIFVGMRLAVTSTIKQAHEDIDTTQALKESLEGLRERLRYKGQGEDFIAARLDLHINNMAERITNIQGQLRTSEAALSELSLHKTVVKLALTTNLHKQQQALFANGVTA